MNANTLLSVEQREREREENQKREREEKGESKESERVTWSDCKRIRTFPISKRSAVGFLIKIFNKNLPLKSCFQILFTEQSPLST